MAKKYDIPKLDNLTDGGLADLLAEAREKEKEGKFYAGFFGEALKARLKAAKKLTKGTEVIGEEWCATVGISEVERFDVTACKEAAEAGDVEAARVIAKFTKSSEVVQLRTTKLAVPNKVETKSKPKK